MWALWCFHSFLSLSWSEYSQRKQEPKEPSSLFLYFPSLSITSLSLFSHFITKPSFLSSTFSPFSSPSFISLFLRSSFWFFGFWVVLVLSPCDLITMMKKKMKGVAVPLDIAPAQAFSSYDDPRVRLRHQSLKQDYEELLKEMEAKKKKLQMMKQKKATLQSEVRFLRRRHQYLMDNQPSTSRVDQTVMAQHTPMQSKKMAKERNISRRAPGLPRPPLGFDLNKKGKIYNEKESTSRNPVPVFDLNQKLKSYHGKESNLQNSTLVLDLNQKERVYSGKEAAVQNMTPAFDLNKISREEEELQFDNEPWRVEESKKGSARGGSDEQLNDMKLSVCRNIGNGANRSGKRKISWQDQVALRV